MIVRYDYFIEKAYTPHSINFNANIKLKDPTILFNYLCIFIIYLLANYSSNIHLLMQYVSEGLIFRYYGHCEEHFQIVNGLAKVSSNFLLAFKCFCCLFRNVKRFLMIMLLLAISLAVILR